MKPRERGRRPVPLSDLLEELRTRWERNECPPAEIFVDQLGPDPDPTEAVDLIYLEVCLAEAHGEIVDREELLERFPRWRDLLERRLALHEAFSIDSLFKLAEDSGLTEEAPPQSGLPGVGDAVGPFQLLRLLGKGGYASVYLAQQTSPSRLVVVKLSTRATAEPQLMAEARHPNVVEIYECGEAECENGVIQILAMPFLGGAPLSDVIEEIRGCNRPKRGADLLAALDRVAAKEYRTAQPDCHNRISLAQSSYPKAVADLIRRLAKALQYANNKGITHGDIKPSNILLTADANPMLLDFNLAVDERLPLAELHSSGSLAGTLAYMAPEALRCISESGPATFDRARADLYSLGLVFVEMLTGIAPTVPDRSDQNGREIAKVLADVRTTQAKLRRTSKDGIPNSLKVVLEKCLAPNPMDRYWHACELTEDLSSWISGEPLVYARTQPVRSRIASLIKRYHVPMMVGSAIVALGAVASGSVMIIVQQSRQEAALAKIANTMDNDEEYEVNSIENSFQWVSRERHNPGAIAVKRLAKYGLNTPRDFRSADDFLALPAADRAEVEMWVLEQVLRLAQASADRPGDSERHKLALIWIKCARGIYAFDALEVEASRLRVLVGLPAFETRAEPESELVAPPHWLNEYLLGVAAESEHVAKSIEHYKAALDGRPGSFLIHLRLGHVYARYNHLKSATEALEIAHTLRPNHVGTHIRLASILGTNTGVNRLPEALRHAQDAISLHPEGTEGYRLAARLEPAFAHQEATESAIEKYSNNLTEGAGVARLRLRLYSSLGLGRPSQDNPRESFALASQVLAKDPDDETTRLQQASGLQRMVREDGQTYLTQVVMRLDSVLRDNPDHLRALYHRGFSAVLARHGNYARFFSQLAIHPRFDELAHQEPAAVCSLQFLALAEANGGNHDEALTLAERALHLAELMNALASSEQPNFEHFSSMTEPNYGTVEHLGTAHYQMARVHAILAASGRPDHLKPCVSHLMKARELRPSYQKLTKDFGDDEKIEAIRESLIALCEERMTKSNGASQSED